MKFSTLLASASVCVFSGLALSDQSHAQPAQIEIGTLTCSGSGGVGYIIGSKKFFDCRFRSAADGYRERYSASITKIGLDVGITGPTTIVWTVLAAERRLRPRALAGNYVGATANASIGVGGGANALVGGSKRSFTLQPFSIQGQSGVNLAVAVSGLRLR